MTRIKDLRNKIDLSQCEWERASCRVAWASKGLIAAEGAGPRGEFRPCGHVSCLATPPSLHEEHFACGGDDGVLRLFARPCLDVSSLGRPNFAHAAPITGVAYAEAADTIVSVSVNLAVVQWEVTVPLGPLSTAASAAAAAGGSDAQVAGLQDKLTSVQVALRSKDLTRALALLDQAFQRAEGWTVAQDWQGKLAREVRHVLKTASLMAKKLAQEAALDLDRGNINRKGWPAHKCLDDMADLCKQVFDEAPASVQRLLPDMQAEVDGLRDMERLAAELHARMQALVRTLHEGFGKLDDAQGHLDALLGQLRSQLLSAAASCASCP